MPLGIKSRQAGGVTVLELSGKIILGEESSSLRERIRELLANGQNKILLNLENVTFIDSAGVGTLVSSFTSARAQGAQLKLANLTRKFRETLQVTRLLTVFEVFDQEADALASFK
ncbi:MAG: STAS domain-containing protein [Acidobacteria bacterium]|nr:STAS domain-containing protein [Acidobacteriota bacterium]